MPALVCDPDQVDALIKHRQEMGGDRYDEVWDGLYIMSPLANPEHQRIITALSAILWEVIDRSGRGHVYSGANVTDREDDWKQNYRVPDVVVILKESEARCRIVGAAICGGPDFLVEVRSPGDKSLDKLDFYASIGVRELLVVDRDTKLMQLFRLQSGRLQETAPIRGWHDSAVVGLSFRTGADATLEVKSTQAPHQTWRI